MIAYFSCTAARTRRARRIVRTLGTGLALTSLIACEDVGDVMPEAREAGGATVWAPSDSGIDTGRTADSSGAVASAAADASPALDAAASADGSDAALLDASMAAPEPPRIPGADSDASLGLGSPATETNRQPLAGSPGEWTYIELPGTQCRDGSPTGVAVNFGSSNKLMIYLAGGGWCIDEESCSVNLDGTAAQVEILALGLIVGVGGVFDRANLKNPVRDWNFVYVPYCTGDMHAGANPYGDVPGVGPQRFVGYLNMTKFLQRIVPTFQDPGDVLLVGASAGGYGALFNTLQVQRAFPSVKLKTISDSGPPLSKAIFAACLQERARTLFRFDKTFLADCGAACPDPNGYIEDFALHLARTLADRPGGLIESAQDAVLRAYLGAGADDCTAPLDTDNPGLSGPAFRAELLAFRERVEPFPEFGTFYPDDEQHTWLPGVLRDDFYTDRAGGMMMVDWFARIVNGQAPGHAGP